MVLQNSFLVPNPMLSVQSSRGNCISRVELWRNRPFSGELPGFWFGGFPVQSSTAFMQNRAKLHENEHIKVELRVFEVQRGPPHDLTKTDEFEQDLSLILDGFETAGKIVS